MWSNVIRFGFRLLYNEFAWTYDLVSWAVSLGEWRRWQFAALEFVQGERVLEIAHGTGHLLPELKKRGSHAIGMDLSPTMSRIAQARVRRLEYHVPLLRGSAMALPFEAASFDTIVTTFPTDFIIHPDTLTNIKQVLANDGRLVIVPSGSLNRNGLVERVIKWLFWVTGQRMEGDEMQAEQVFAGWVGHFGEHGFGVEIRPISTPKSTAIVLLATPL